MSDIKNIFVSHYHGDAHMIENLSGILKKHGLNMVQSFFLWDERCVTGQWRLMSMSFKKKYSSSG